FERKESSRREIIGEENRMMGLCTPGHWSLTELVHSRTSVERCCFESKGSTKTRFTLGFTQQSPFIDHWPRQQEITRKLCTSQGLTSGLGATT
ncbi:hypothetical protein BgiBS90_005805, partial [Biomphalaria glabrata]